MGIYDSIALSKEKEEREQRRFYHNKFRAEWLSAVFDNPQKFMGDVYKEDPDKKGVLLLGEEGRPDIPVDYSKCQTVICCPEPIEFIKAFNPIMNNQDECKALMRKLVSGDEKYGKAIFKKIELNHSPKDGKWFNSTKNGINLRPGILNDDINRMDAVSMADVAVHGLIVGRTGSGKSVFLNDLIINFLLEYAPWELDIYLADFKKVELSRYMTKYATPHLKTCAATGEIRYVITMLQYIVDCMQARQDLFTRLGIQKISEFRDRYGIVLPRVILIIDEFQQMFQEAVKREPSQIQDALMSITKLGRATGFHLLFASQEMNGTLGGKAMANFKIRFALQCDSEVSGSILGNSAASTLERGYVLANVGSGKIDENMQYKVPFIPEEEDDESYFYALLHEMKDDAESFAFEKNKTFYQEDFQLPISKLSEVLERIKPYKKVELTNNRERYLDIFTLGRGVVYTDKKYDLESVYIERGRNKNIIAVCSNVDDLAYLKKLLALNFAHSPMNDRYAHIVYEFSPIIAAKYNIKDDLENTKADSIIVNKSIDAMKYIYSAYDMRQAQIQASKMDSVEQYIAAFINGISSQNVAQKEAYERLEKRLLNMFDDCTLDNIENRCREILKEDKRYWQQIEPVYNFYLNKVKNHPWSNIFQPIVYWISGMEYIEKVDKKLPAVMKNSMDTGILFVIFTDSIKSIDSNKDACVKTCEYIFVNSTEERVYDKFGMSFTKKRRNSIAIDFKIRSLNTERAFKKYHVEEMVYKVPEIDFDSLLD